MSDGRTSPKLPLTRCTRGFKHVKRDGADDPSFPFEATSSRAISFVLPTRNRPGFLDAALLRLREIVRDEDELIVIEGDQDAPSDSVLGQYSDIIDVAIREADISPAHAYNKGLMLARGSFVKIVQDDDVIYREPIDRAVELFERNEDVDVIVCGGIRRQGDVEQYFYVPPGVSYGRNACDPLEYGGTGVGMILRRSVLPRTGLFNTGIGPMDTEFLCRAIERGVNVRFARLNMFYHEVYSHSAAVAMQARMARDSQALRLRYCGERVRWWNRLRTALGRNRPIGRPARAVRNLLLGAPEPGNPGLHPPLDAREGEPAPVWDGGFS